MTQKWARLERAWNRFWFEYEAPISWRLFRQSFCGLLFLFYLSRLPDLFFVYSEDGMFPRAVLEELFTAEQLRIRPSLLGLSPSPVWLIGLYLLFMATLAGLVAGWRVRLLSVVAWVLQLSFLHRAMYTMYGFDKVATVFLAYLALAGGGEGPRWATSMGMRFLQAQVLIIYAYSGLEKLKGVTWWNGEALWWVISNPQQVSLDLTWLARFPALIALPAYLTLIWEIYFPAAMFSRVLRPFWLLAGVIFHLIIGVYLNIPFFGLAMILSYAAFVKDEEWTMWASFLPRRTRDFTLNILK